MSLSQGWPLFSSGRVFSKSVGGRWNMGGISAGALTGLSSSIIFVTYQRTGDAGTVFLSESANDAKP